MPLIIGVTAGGVLIPVRVDDDGIVSVSSAVSSLPSLPAGDNNIGNVDVLTLGRSINKLSATGTGAISASHVVTGNERLTSVILHFNVAPTTSQAFTIKLNANAGDAYDTLLATVNPADEALTDYVYIPDGDLYLKDGDAIDLAFTNTDGKTYGVQITTENV